MSAYSDALRKSIRKQFGEDAAYQNRIRYASNIGNVEEEPSAISKALGPVSETAKSLFNAWGQNVQNAYDNSPMYADIRGAGNAWDADTSYKNPSSYYDNNTYLGSLANSAIGGSAGVVGGIADMLGAEKLGDRAAGVQAATRDDNAISPEFSWEYFTNPHGLARSTGNTLGSMATLAPAMALMPESTALGIAARLGGNKGVQFLIDNGYNYLAKRLAQTLPNAVRWAGTTSGLESLAEGGGTVREAKELGLDDPYGRGWRTAAANLPGLIASNLAEGLILGGIGKAKPGSSIMRRLGTIPASALTEGAQNSLEEGYQQAVQNINLGKPITDGMSEAMKEGFFGSLLLGGAGGVYHAANANRGIAPENTQEFGDWLNGANPSQDYSQFNPMTDPTRTAERDNDIPIPGNIDYTEADPSDIVNDWLSKQAGFGNVNANVDMPQAQQGQPAQASQPIGNIDLSDIPMQDFEDKGLAKTNNALKSKFRQLYDWTVQQFGKKVEISGGWRSPEHNKEVNGSEHSHHLSGNALDVNISMLSDAERDAFIQKAKEMGFNADGDDFYHDKGSGYHAHLVYKDDGSANQTASKQTNATKSTGNSDYDAWIAEYSQKHGVPANILYALLKTESNFNPNAESSAGAIGIAQFMPDTAKAVGIDPLDPKQAIEGAAIYLKQKFDKYGDWHTALRAYNGGDGGINLAEAKTYADKVLAEAGNSNTISAQDFGKILGNHMIDFAGSEDDAIMNNYQQIMDSLGDDAKSVLANKFANMFNADGSFNNTAENRQALAQDAEAAEVIRSMAESAAPQIVAPMLDKNGRIRKQAVKDYFTPYIAGMNMHFLKDAINKDKLSDVEKVAVLQEAENQLNIPRLKKSDVEQAKFVNDLQKAIDARDFKKIYNLMPQDTAKAIAKVTRPAQAQPAMPIVTQEQADARLNGIQGLTNTLNAVAAQKWDNSEQQMTDRTQNLQGLTNILNGVAAQKWDAGEQQARDMAMNLREPAKAPARQMATPEEQARLNALTGQQNGNEIILPNQQNPQEAEANLNALRQSAGVVEGQPEAPQVPGVLQTAEDKVAANSAQARQWQIQNALRNGDYDLASRLMREDGRNVGADILDSVPRRPYSREEFNNRLAELHNMPLRQLEQVGQQTLDNMQAAGVPVSEGLANDLAAGKENAIAHAESKMAEAGVNPTVSNQEQVQSDVALQTTNEPTSNKESKTLKQSREKATKVVEQYRDDKITYEEAFSKLEEMYVTADNAAKTKAEHDTAAQTFLSAGENLERVRQEKETQPQKPDYSNMSLDELKAERQRFIDEEVDRMNRNPGGKGTNNGYTYNERGEITGRYGESLNPQWYQDAYAELGHKPRKKEYPDIALKNLQKHQEFAELEDAIATQEKESAKNEPSTETEATENATSNEEVAPETENPFGDLDETFADLAKQAGITPIEQEKAEPEAKSTTKEKPKKKKRNMGLSDTSKEREEELKKQLSEALKKSRNRLNSTPVIFDPDVIVPAFNLGRLYVQRGAESFAEYARDMINAVGDSVRGWLRPVWEMIENYPDGKNIDESLVIPAFRYVGSFMHSKPQATYDEVRADFVKRAGEDTAAKFDDLLKLAYSGAYKFYNDNEEVTDNEFNDSSRQDSARDSAGNNQDKVGAVHGDGESVSRGGQGVQQTGKDSRSQRSGSVHGRSSSRSGEASDSGVQGSESGRGNRNDSTGGKQLTGSRRDSYDGPAVDDGRNAESFGTAKNRPVDGRSSGNKTETVKVNKDSFKAGDKAQIAGSMPFLMKEQVDDVVKADNRLYANNGEGMMFTNGTGTGKTFTGLGCIKRAVQQGKKNILIIAPTDKVQNDWITTGKGFFGLNISKLENTTDAGEGIVITSYENVGANNKLVKRDWDMIVTDESHKLMQGEKGNRTKALENVRAMTYHADGLRERFERLHAKEYDRLAELRGKASDKEHPITAAEKQELEKLQAKLIKEQEKAVAEWKQIPQADKPKVLFLSATPFSYVPDIDYAEGYLFHYDRKKNQNGGYNQPNAYDDFMIKHFGYRMRMGKLTKPDADVNSDLMEINFNNWLKDQGVLSGRKLQVKPDYERGYILVDGGVGKQIDEGMKIATEWGVSDSDQKYGKLHDLFENKLKGNKTRYLLEAIKAKEAVNLIKQYTKAGKKVVVFHDFKKNEAENPFVLTDEDFKYMDEVDRNTARQQYARFCKDHPELLNLNLDDLQSPIERFTEEFGDSLRIFNGDIPKKKRENAVREFQDDSSKVNIILCQRASAKEGISMHDTTGKHQRVLIDLGLATRPTDLIQGEGRIYRTGVITDAIIRYLNTGTDMEKRAFASTIAGRASTAENLSMGEDARALRNAIVEGFMESIDGDSWKKYLPNSKTEGKGGKERDAKLMDGVTPYEAAKSDYFANQKKNSRNKAQEGIDYFPTPEPIGFKMVEWLGLKPGDRALEPSAGHGAISRYFGAETRNTIVEPSPELATLAKMRLNGGETAKVVESRFEDLDIHNKYEGIAMNPPYGVGGKTAYEHVAKAFDHLADGGRLIAIVPDGPAANKRLENWLIGDGTKANPGKSNAALLTEIKLPQVTFNRAGTSVATKILIIDKYNDPADFRAMELRQIEEGIDSLDLTGVKDINELFDKLEYVRTPERVGSDIPRHFTNSTNKKGNAQYKYITLPDDVKLLDNRKVWELANFNGGYRNINGGWFEFRNENDRAKFNKAANKYLAGQETLAAEQQEIVDETLTPTQTEHFEGGEFEGSPKASIKGYIDRKTVYPSIKSIAQEHGGRYSKGARGFIFDDAAERDQFLQEAEAFMGKGSYSTANGRALTKDERDELWSKTAVEINNNMLTPAERELQEMAKTMGATLKFVTADPRLQGKYAGGVSYINRNAKASASWIAWHEMFHWIKSKNKPLYEKMLKTIKENADFSKEQLNKYRASIGVTDMDDNMVIEEMFADAFPEVRQRVPFFRNLAKENVSLYKQLVAFVKRVIDNLVARFNAAYTKGNGLNVRQMSLMHNAFCDMVRDIKGADGKPIFKVGNDGYREITDMEGNTTEQILDVLDLVAENNLGIARYSLDNSETLTDNERRGLDRIKDDMSFAEAREQLLSKENAAVATALAVYERLSKSGNVDTQMALNNLREARDYAEARRREYTTERNVRNLERLLRDRGQAKAGSYLAETIQGVLDTIRGEGVSNVLTAIPGEYRSMYKKAAQILGDTYSVAKHSQYEGASLDVEYFSAIRDMENAKTDTEREAARQKLVEMVEQKAKDAGFENAIPEQTKAYKVRTKAAPKKTKKVYKVFTVADDGSPTALFVGSTEKLPQGVWLDGQDTYHFQAKNGNYYVPSTQNPYSQGGTTGKSVEIPNAKVRQELVDRGYLSAKSKAAKVTGLAYRPGWHAGTLPLFPQGGMKRAGSNYKNIHRYNQVVFECELAADKNYTPIGKRQAKAIKKQDDGIIKYFIKNLGAPQISANPTQEEINKWVDEVEKYQAQHDPSEEIRDKKGNPVIRTFDMLDEEGEKVKDEDGKYIREKRAVTWGDYQPISAKSTDLQYMPEDGFYYYATNPLTMNNPSLGAWCISSSLKIGRALTQEECDRILAEHDMLPQEWEQGEMSLEDLGYTGEEHDAARKTLAPITYDDNGNIIPLSQRFDAEKDDVRYSVAPVNPPGAVERIKNATRKLLGLQEKLEDNVQDRHTEKQNQKTSLDDTIPLTAMAHSMKYLAGKNEAIKRMYYLGKRCMDEQEHLRNEFKEVIRKINTLMADEADRDSLHALLWAGDADGKEYTTEELQQEGFSDNVIAAYKMVRDNLAKAYNLVNDARMQVKVRNRTIKASELPEFMKENFIDSGDVINTQDVGNGKIVVTYRGAKVYENRTDIVNDDMLKAMEADDNIVITNKDELGKGVYNITYNEKPQPMGKLTGYMPHFFHRFMVYAKTKDEDGNDMRVAIGSAESLADATKIANEVAKRNPDMQFVIDTHSFEYGDENNGVVVGDLNYQEMTKRLAENTEMSLTEANKFLHDSAGATLKSRHRFFGNMMKRTGVQGFDENMMWALTHYFNSAARYVAMEHFKPDAISWYERFFGDFNADPKTIKGQNKRKTAQIIRDYINDVNGTPREIEKWCNEVVDRIPIIGEKLNDTYNGRPALALSSKVSWFNAVTKLGCLSISSPMLNFMQFINVATMLDSVKYAKMGLNKALKPSELDNLILDRSGIMDEINLASDAGGYTQSRDYGGKHKGLGKGKELLDKSMFFFTWCDALMRKAAVLGAYYQGVQEKGMKPDNGQAISAEALEYAREVNSEANFDYSAANTPEAIRMGSVITQQAFQFQKYPIMQFEFFWNHVVHGTNSQRAKFLMPYFLLTGLPGMIPFGELLAGMLGLLIPGDDDDFAKKMKAELMRWAGDDSAKQAVVNSLTNGPLAAFTGIDISERAGMQNFFAGRYYGSKPESTPGAVGTLLGGAAYSTVSGVQNQLRNGNPIEAIKAVSPGLGNWLQAAVGETRTTHHRVGSTYDGMYERILHGMGFRHIDETNTQFINSYLYESRKRQQEDKKFVMDAYLDDPSEENKEQLVFWGISDKELKKYSEGREKSSRDRAAGDEPKKKSKKPKTEAQIEDDKLRAWAK